MKRNFVLLAFAIIMSFPLYSQSNKLDKKLEKAYNYIKKDKLDDAADYLNDILKENPGYGDGWDLLVKIRIKQYEDAKKTDIFKGNITVTTKDKDGNDVKSGNDSLAQSFMKLINDFNPSKTAKKRYINDARRATLYCNEAYYASIILRSVYVDPEVDTNVCSKALKYFNEAEEEFQNKNYQKAARLYIRAIEKQPDFYKASLYLGDAYYFLEFYDDALKYFKEAVSKFPKMLEPRKYLIDTYGKLKLFNKAAEEAINALMIYPDLTLAERLNDVLYYNNKKLNIEWTSRGCFPNKLSTNDDYIIKSKEKSDNEVSGAWLHYKNAMEKIKEFCDNKGVITRKNQLTQAKYLEVYSWEQMLNNSNDASLDQARKMMKEGYLDCYVFITCFHIDIYDQYLDFVSTNGDRIKEYFQKHIE